jgi:hypothetical protein
MWRNKIWLKWLSIDEFDEHNRRKLRSDAPDDVKEAYKKYIDWQDEYIKRGEPIPR